MLNALYRTLFLPLARRSALASFLVGGGMRRPDSVVRRFVGAETIAELVGALREIDGQGFTQPSSH